MTETSRRGPPLRHVPLFLRGHRNAFSSTIAFQKIVLGATSKKLRHEPMMLEPNNISFESDSKKDRENVDPSSQVAHSRHLMSGSFQVLGNLTHKNNEDIINAIM